VIVGLQVRPLARGSTGSSRSSSEEGNVGLPAASRTFRPRAGFESPGVADRPEGRRDSTGLDHKDEAQTTVCRRGLVNSPASACAVSELKIRQPPTPGTLARWGSRACSRQHSQPSASDGNPSHRRRDGSAPARIREMRNHSAGNGRSACLD